MVAASEATPPYQTRLTGAITEGRAIDRGNASVRSIQTDFRRLGLAGMIGRIGSVQPRWSTGDRQTFEGLLDLRNSFAHGNATERQALRRRGILDTISWTKRTLTTLNRTPRAMDRVVRERLVQATGAEPWE